MDGDSLRQENKKAKSKKESKDSSSSASDFLQPSWVRCPVCSSDEVDGVLLDYGRYFLLPVAAFLWILFFIVS